MEFVRYPKMSEGATSASKLPPRTKWMASEKIHGANVSFYCDGITIRAAKRTSFISNPFDFFNYSPFLSRNEDRICGVMTLLHPRPDYFIIYGELFGGWYPPDPSRWTGAKGTRISDDNRILVAVGERAVQEGVYYCPDIQFVAFDLMVVTGQTRSFLPYSKAREIFQAVGLRCVEPLVVGPLAAVADTKVGFDSTLPALLGQAALPSGSNPAEGVVVRPFDAVADGRIYKTKYTLFREVAQTFASRGSKRSEGEHTLSSVLAYATNNRAQSAISKVGSSSEVRAEARAEFVEDCLASLAEDCPQASLRSYSDLCAALEKAFDKLTS